MLPSGVAKAFSQRLLIIGNSGSGKSTLAEHVARRTSQAVFDLDLIHWHDDRRKRDEDQSRGMVRAIVPRPAWIIEGVYGWLADVAAPRATALVWIDLPWLACRDGLLRRGLRRGMTEADQDALLAWAEAYQTRSTPSSASGHGRLFAAFDGLKVRTSSREDLDALVAAVEAEMSPDP